MKRSLRLRVLVVLAAALLGACGGSGASSDAASGASGASASTSGKATGSPITIALVSELSGANALIGKATQAGVETAVQVINDGGGIDGHPIELKTFDTQTNPTVAPAVFREAYGTHPAAVVGFVGSATVAGAVSLIAASDVPFVTDAIAFPGVKDVDYFFSTSPGNESASKAVVHTLVQKLGTLQSKRIFIQVASPSPAFDEKVGLLQTAIEGAGGKVVNVDRTPFDLSSYTSQAAAAADLNPDAAVLMHGEAPLATIATALNVAGLTKIPIVADVVASSDELLQKVNAPNFFVLRDAVPVEPSYPIYNVVPKKFLADAQSSPYFNRAYSSMMLTAKTLQKCGASCATDDFVKTVHGFGTIDITPSALNGPLDFKAGQAGNNFFQVWSWDSGANKSAPVGDVFNALEEK